MSESIAALLGVVPVLLGGVGLFLIGMILMSEGLKAAAGGALQHILERFTRTPLAACLSGAGLTAVVQSSSATTVTTIGFVSAGLLSFSSAFGVIVGANVGTTSTGWIVSLLGLKLNLGAVALPLIGAAALMRLLSSGRRASLSMAAAGFGLIFVGIDVLQDGMGGLATRIDLSAIQGDSPAGSLLLVLAGAVMTVLLQSSSAAVALSLTALHGGAISLPQTAYLVIGQNLGTTVKALLASIGASIPARRTALAHILFNGLTGALTFVLAVPLLAVAHGLARAFADGDASMTIALFHTMFNLLGALIFLPISKPFTRWITRMIPDRGPQFTSHLDRSILQVPSVAIEAVARAQVEIAAAMLRETLALLEGAPPGRPARERLEAAHSALGKSRAFVNEVRLEQNHREEYNRRLMLLHAGDHLNRLNGALRERETSLAGVEVRAAAGALARELAAAADLILPPKDAPVEAVERAGRASTRQAERRRHHRAFLLAETAAGKKSPDETGRELEAMRWIDRVGYHAWRALHHLSGTPSLLNTDGFEDAAPPAGDGGREAGVT